MGRVGGVGVEKAGLPQAQPFCTVHGQFHERSLDLDAKARCAGHQVRQEHGSADAGAHVDEHVRRTSRLPDRWSRAPPTPGTGGRVRSHAVGPAVVARLFHAEDQIEPRVAVLTRDAVQRAADQRGRDRVVQQARAKQLRGGSRGGSHAGRRIVPRPAGSGEVRVVRRAICSCRASPLSTQRARHRAVVRRAATTSNPARRAGHKTCRRWRSRLTGPLPFASSG